MATTYTATGIGSSNVTRTSARVKDAVRDYGGGGGDEAQLLNGLVALGYDPQLVRSFSDADPNRRFLNDAVTRALRAGVNEADVKRALAASKAAASAGDPVLRVRDVAQALGLDMVKVSQAATRLAGQSGRAQPAAEQWVAAVNEVGGLNPDAAGTFSSLAQNQPAAFLYKGQAAPPAPAAPATQGPAIPSPGRAPAGPVGGPRMQVTGPAPAPAAPRPAPAPAAPRVPAPGGSPPPADTTPKLAPNASPADALQFIKEHYGYGAWIFEQPQVRDVLISAAKDGHWSDARLNGALGATDFFKANDGNVVKWLNTESNDPATARALVEKKVNDVITKAQTLGMDLDPERARQIATDANKFNWDDTQLTKAVGHEYHYNPTMAQKGIAKTIRDTARLYGIPMTDSGLDEWGRKVGSGDATADDFKATMIGQAKSLFPTLAGDLDRGATVKDIFDPYAKLAATTLGVDESSIDILDPKWQRPLQSTDGKNPTRMSTYDWTKTLRTDAAYGWDTTDNARQEAADFAHRLRQGFGLA